MNYQNTNITSLFFIGHFAIDNIIRFKRISKATLGGSVSYCSLALRKYTQNAKISIISHVGTKNLKNSLLAPIKNKNIDLRGIKYSEVKNTNFVLDYFDHARTLTLQSRSPNLEFKHIPSEYFKNPPDIFVLVPLCNEISFEYISQISKNFPTVYLGIDLQGFLRTIDENGKISYLYNDQVISTIENIIDLFRDKLILKGSEEEMRLFTAEYQDPSRVMLHFKKYNSNGLFIMTLGEQGSMIYKKGNPVLKVPAFKPKRVSDETGAGDVYFSIFLYELLQSDKSWTMIKHCAFLASAAASFLVEKKGPSGFVVKTKVIERLNKKEYIR